MMDGNRTESGRCKMIKLAIKAGAQAMGIELSAAQAEQFDAYHALLLEGNARMNLTRIRVDEPREAVDRHYLDSIAPLAEAGLLRGCRNLVDVGAGAGLPGVPLSILLPGTRVVMLDALRKRVAFLSDVIERLGLNAEAVHLRAEDAGRDAAYRERFDAAVARAVAGLPKLLELALPLVAVGGVFVAYKGPTLDDELRDSAAAIRALGGGKSRVLDAAIPGRADWSHKLCAVKKADRTPRQYPRKPAEIEARPIA